MKRPSFSLPAGALSDIAFLLVIFFLVATEIHEEKGIPVNLPAWGKSTQVVFHDRSFLDILINEEGDILVNKDYKKVEDIAEQVALFLEATPLHVPAVINLQYTRGLSYESYLLVYDQIKRGHRAVWEEMAEEIFQTDWKQLTEKEMAQIKRKRPLKVEEPNTL